MYIQVNRNVGVADILIGMIQGADMDMTMCKGVKCNPAKRETCHRYMAEPGTIQWYATFNPYECKAYIKTYGKVAKKAVKRRKK